MHTLILQQPGHFELKNTKESASPGVTEALVRVHRVGICGTDIHAFRGRQPFFSYPRILGHELAVEILALGTPHPALQVGDRCAVEPYLNCGNCRACQQGKTNCCVSLQVLGVHVDGGMREFLCVPVTKLHRANTLSWEQIALIETLGIGAHAVQRSHLIPTDKVLVIGAGPIGLAVLQFAMIAGARPTVMDIDEHRLQFCVTKLGAPSTVQSTTDDSTSTLETLKELTAGELFDVVFDATGNSQSMQRSFTYLGQGGKLIFVGLFNGEISFNDPDFHRRELTVIASRNSTAADFQRIIGLIENSTLDTTPWVTHQCEPAKFAAEFPNWLRKDSRLLKGMIDFEKI